MVPGPGKRRARFVLPGLYLALALYIWIDFAATAHDGLANLGLMVITLPVTFAGLLLGSPAVAITALLLWLLGRAIDRRRAA